MNCLLFDKYIFGFSLAASLNQTVKHDSFKIRTFAVLLRIGIFQIMYFRKATCYLNIVNSSLFKRIDQKLNLTN